MTASLLDWAFGRHAARLARMGYDVIPISRANDRTYTYPGKQPAQRRGWSDGCRRQLWPEFAECGVGILTARTPALDIDVLEPKVAGAIQWAADRELGDVPVRVGQAPKRLLPYRLAGEPFGKIRLEWRKGLGADLHPATKAPGVEILANGQQFVAFGVHPGTGQPYHWYRDPNLSLAHGLLTPRSHSDFVRFVHTLAKVLERLGAEQIKIGGPGWPSKHVTVQRPRPQAAKGSARRIRDALERRGNPDLHYDDWIRLGHAIKAELPGDDGLAVWEWWSGLSPKNNPRITTRKWATFRPSRISAGTVFWEAPL